MTKKQEIDKNYSRLLVNLLMSFAKKILTTAFTFQTII